jgi:hypothetical protein
LLAFTGNELFGQNWTVPDHSPKNHTPNPAEKVKVDLTYQMPARSTLQLFLKYASMLNFHHLAVAIISARKLGKVVCWGTDDTTKASGFVRHDMKANHITINDENSHETYSTGFLPNISHKGEDSAVSVRLTMNQLSVAAQVEPEEMEDCIDFILKD